MKNQCVLGLFFLICWHVDSTSTYLTTSHVNYTTPHVNYTTPHVNYTTPHVNYTTPHVNDTSSAWNVSSSTDTRDNITENSTTSDFLFTTETEQNTSASYASTVVFTESTVHVTGNGGTKSAFIETTSKPANLNILAYVMSATTGVFLIAFIVALICTFKLRTKLKHCSNTLYSDNPGEQSKLGPNVYLDLNEKNKKNKELRVELTHMTVHHDEEEFDSPTLAPSPPLSVRKPRKDPAPPPPPPASTLPASKSTDDVPALPKRTTNINAQKLKKANSDRQSLLSKSTKVAVASGIANTAFVNNETTFTAKDTGDDDDGLYESYDTSNSEESDVRKIKYAPSTGSNHSSVEEPMPYEEPINTSGFAQNLSITEELMRRQNSSTGLPALINRNSSLEMQENPLQMTDDDNMEFGRIDSNTGLPPMVALQTFDDLRYFEDAETIAKSDVDSDESVKKPTLARVTSSSSNAIDDELTYDDADMDIADDIDGIENDEEPGMYEDYEPDNDLALPAVPPRRDIQRRSPSKRSVGKFDNMVLSNVPEGLNTEVEDYDRDSQMNSLQVQPNGQVQFKPGRVSEYGIRQKRDSYFMFKEDKTGIMTESETLASLVNEPLFMGQLSSLVETHGIADQIEALQGLSNGSIPNANHSNNVGVNRQSLNRGGLAGIHDDHVDDDSFEQDDEDIGGGLYDVPPPTH